MSKYVTQPGRYRAYVQRPTSGGWLAETENGAEYVRIPLVIDPEDPLQGGAVIIWNGYISSDKSIARTARMMLEALKAPTNWFDLLVQGDGFLEGRVVAFTVEQKIDQDGQLVTTKKGEPIFEATWLNDPDSRPAGTPLNPAKMSSLSRKLQAISKSVHSELQGKAGYVPPRPPAPQQRPPAPAPHRTVHASDPVEDFADDDIPF
jgi:hypothetical protein